MKIDSFISNPEALLALEALDGYPNEYRDRIGEALTEAWIWLEREGLVAPKPGQTAGDWVFITRRGQKIKNKVDLEAFRNANQLPKQLLHPVISSKTWSTFLRGEYDTAVFQAYKEVEVAVRDKGGYAPNDIGVDLMRKAFNPVSGPLTDRSVPESEREATAHLFAGAIGLYKNPHSHRDEPITDVAKAVAMLMLASHFLNIVDSRANE